MDHRDSISSSSGFYSINNEETEDLKKASRGSKSSKLSSNMSYGGGKSRGGSFKTCKDGDEDCEFADAIDDTYQPPSFDSPKT